MATEKDVLQAKSRFNRICELIDRILVSKTMDFHKSLVTTEITYLLASFLGMRR